MALRCSPKMLNEHLRKLLLLPRLTAKALKLLMCMEPAAHLSGPKVLKMLSHIQPMSILAKTCMNTSSSLRRSLSILAEHLSAPPRRLHLGAWAL